MTAGPDPGGAPSSPGVYMMRDQGGSIIYVGKAKNLRNRVRSYFAGAQDAKTQRLVESVASIEYILTDTEGEAFLLESNMIKRHRPRYNIELKDQQRYTYLRITDEKYPRLLVARRTRGGGFLGRGETFGPFTHGSSKLLTVGALRKAFQMRVCRTLPKKVCLEYHIGNCEGPCEFQEARDRYAGNVSALRGVLRGGAGAGRFAASMEEEMRRAAGARQFERALEIRDTLARLGSLRSGQKVEKVAGSDEEYFGIGRRGGVATVMSFRVVQGVIRDSGRFSFEVVADNTLSSFLSQYYSSHPVPRLVLTSEEPGDAALLESVLSGIAGRRTRISVPARGRRRELMAMLMRSVGLVQAEGGDPALARLGSALGLPGPPRVIECFDISNHGADFAVGAMSRLVDGEPDGPGYRRFRVRGVRGRDDYAMMAEVVGRRYRRLLREGSRMPDLVVVDGGKGQLGAAVGAIKGAGATLHCVSLAKEREEVFAPEIRDPVRVPRGAPLDILRRARDEAHRFGLKYNRAVRRASLK
ncbi:Excinuclease nuclease subunit [Nitrosopumilaceae archaeon]|nr:excinuclease ABC subunit UvrC [Nitrosopumilus sp.]CAI9832516.1 Excinuclease nuclease subunit [Nitrosopumilaceae archaeon]MDA7944814.1 excinuclease ABC subunit UvrC [Nitrosopumilus sp.]MDA7955146.1 excinuclease ABC subunit UvrC [Nitrosopumilus sp.]MDA7974193.1 excinuclease ABC subunit UvrC [Nitrosopumilus sp.]